MKRLHGVDALLAQVAGQTDDFGGLVDDRPGRAAAAAR
jgi:hypothetical protein